MRSFWLWVCYYYHSELYDRSVCSGTHFETGDGIPINSNERILIERNARMNFNKIIYLKAYHGIHDDTWNSAKHDASRYSFEGLEKLMNDPNNPERIVNAQNIF